MEIEVTGLNKVTQGIHELGFEIKDLSGAFENLAAQAAQAARLKAPLKTGKLRNSIESYVSKNRAVVVAGSGRVPYAGPINYGWKRRNIEPARFMERADEVFVQSAGQQLEAEISKLIKESGLT